MALRRSSLSWLAFSVVTALAGAQTARLAPGEMDYSVNVYRPEITLTAQATLVGVEAVVRNGAHEPVDGLTREDFEIRDDGVPQRISNFSVVRHAAEGKAAAGSGGPPGVTVSATPSATPWNILIFVDDLDTAIYGINNARRGALDYLKSDLAPNEWIGVATASGIGAQDFTQDRAKIVAALNQITPHPRGCDPTITYHNYEFEMTFSRGVSDERAGGRNGAISGPCIGSDSVVKVVQGEIQARAVYEALLSQMQYLGQRPGERIFLLASYGIFSADTWTLGDQAEKIADTALHDHITVNTLDTQGAGELLATVPDLDFMNSLSQATGGRLFYGDNGFEEGVRELTHPPAVAYELSFAPTRPQRDGKLHQLAVSLIQHHGLEVAARSGYYAPAPDEPGLDTLREAMRKAVMATTTETALPADAGATARAGAGLAVAVRVRTPSLPLVAGGGVSSNTVLAIAELFDSRGNPVAGQIGQLTLRLKPGSVANFRRPDSTAGMNLLLHVPAGSYRLRTVIGEARTGLLSASNTQVKVP